MLQVLLPLGEAISFASKNKEVSEFVARHEAYLVSTHAIISADNAISTWGLNYYSKALNKAHTFEISQEIGMGYSISSEGLSKLRETDLNKLDLSGTLPIQQVLDKAFKKKVGTINNIIVTVSHPPKYSSPVLRVNFISSQLTIQSLMLNLKTGRILSNVTDNVTGSKVIAGTVKLK